MVMVGSAEVLVVLWSESVLGGLSFQGVFPLAPAGAGSPVDED